MTNIHYMHQLRRAMAKKNPHAVALGAEGGKKTARKGADYFRKIQALRKHRRGGRPRKTKS